MKPGDRDPALETRAAEALRNLLQQVSSIELGEIRVESRGSGRPSCMVAHIRVLGHSHTLVCRVGASSQPGPLRRSLAALAQFAAQEAGSATPLLIAPLLSPRAQALCCESHAAFLDLEGNARLELGEIFIRRRSLPHGAPHEAGDCPAHRTVPAILGEFTSSMPRAATAQVGTHRCA